MPFRNSLAIHTLLMAKQTGADYIVKEAFLQCNQHLFAV